MTPTPMLIKAATEELTSSEIQTALDELKQLNRGGRPKLSICRSGLFSAWVAHLSLNDRSPEYIAPSPEDALCKAHKDLLRSIAEEVE